MKAIAGIFVLLIVVIGAYLLFGTRSPSVEGARYANATYGISFEYPSAHALQEREVGDAHRYHYSITLIDKEALATLPQNGEGPPTISVDIFQNNLDQLSIEQWVRGTNFSNFKLSPDGLLASTTVAGVPALSYTWDGLYRGESTVFTHKDNVIMLSVTYLSRDDQIRADFARVLSSLTLF
ncbi:hypothetical protein HYW60_00050 [Candidatus Kaiserbacteria bacterium]|nr:hypothetical protein [Candidatus Kaiserbacteria bacterium]